MTHYSIPEKVKIEIKLHTFDISLSVELTTRHLHPPPPPPSSSSSLLVCGRALRPDLKLFPDAAILSSIPSIGRLSKDHGDGKDKANFKISSCDCLS